MTNFIDTLRKSDRMIEKDNIDRDCGPIEVLVWPTSDPDKEWGPVSIIANLRRDGNGVFYVVIDELMDKGDPKA